ncbi:ribonuclease H-like domain-containing protein, partial [Tanacetum coccineum]
MSFDDLYNNFKIVEQEVKRTVTSSSNSNSQNVAFVSTPSSTNDVNTASVRISTASIPVSTCSPNCANLSDATVNAFLANQPNGSHIVHEDLEQIHEDDLEAMDLKWQLALLSMRARKYYQRTGNKITINESDVAGYDKGPRNQENRTRNQESINWNQEGSKRTMNVEDTSAKAMIDFDGAGFDWSFMADEELPTNMALMAFSDSEIERLKKEKECNQIRLNSFKNASKSFDEMLGSQIANKSKNGVGFDNYNAVAPPPTCLFTPPPIDLSDSGLKEFQHPEFEGNGVKANESVIKISSNETKKNLDAPIIEEWMSDSKEDESKFREIENVQPNPKQADEPRKISDKPRNNSTNWNKPMSKKLGVGFQFTPKACFVCGINTAKVNSVNTAKGKTMTSAVGEQGINDVKSLACWVWRPKGDPHVALKDTGIFDSGCSRHMTGNKSYISDYQDYDRGFLAFAGSSKGGKIIGKGKIRTGNLDFEDVYFVKELKLNLFSVSQMCDRKNNVLFTETKCIILSPDFKLPDENQVMLKIPRKDNMYSFDLKTLFLQKGNLVRGLPLNLFKNDHTCVACKKEKQHKASLVTDDYSRFSWVFFLAKKDETSSILKNLITDIENQLNHKVKIIRCDNGTEFKNYEINQFCGIKWIKREFSNARTPQQNRVAERKNRTLIEAARTMLADSLLPIQFWTEAVNTAC